MNNPPSQQWPKWISIYMWSLSGVVLQDILWSGSLISRHKCSADVPKLLQPHLWGIYKRPKGDECGSPWSPVAGNGQGSKNGGNDLTRVHVEDSALLKYADVFVKTKKNQKCVGLLVGTQGSFLPNTYPCRSAFLGQGHLIGPQIHWQERSVKSQSILGGHWGQLSWIGEWEGGKALLPHGPFPWCMQCWATLLVEHTLLLCFRVVEHDPADPNKISPLKIKTFNNKNVGFKAIQ